MTENDKVMVQLPETQKVELPISLYLLIFLQIVLLAFLVWDMECAVTYLVSMYYGI